MCIYRVVLVWSDNWNFFFNVAVFEAEFEHIEKKKLCKSSATFWIKEKKKEKKNVQWFILCLKFWREAFDFLRIILLKIPFFRLRI